MEIFKEGREQYYVSRKLARSCAGCDVFTSYHERAGKLLLEIDRGLVCGILSPQISNGDDCRNQHGRCNNNSLAPKVVEQRRDIEFIVWKTAVSSGRGHFI